MELETGEQNGTSTKVTNPKTNKNIPESEPQKSKWVYSKIIYFVIVHYYGFWGVYLFLTLQVSAPTWAWAYLYGWMTTQATMIGAHRFFTHRAFKGTYWFKLLVILTQSAAGQNCIYNWARDHRLHHKYSETDADPHNALRGFVFSHMGWLIQRKHPMVTKMGKNIDMSDLDADRLVQFQKKYYVYFALVMSVLLPVAVPVYLWNETWKHSILVAFFARYMISLHGTWSVNSFAHLYGNKPYTGEIGPVDSEYVAWLTSGEGWHNYHHTFPWDYRASEYGKKHNLASEIVDWFASLGMVYDLKYATPEMIRHRIFKRGDGSHYNLENWNHDDPTTKINDEMDDLFGEKIKPTVSHARHFVS